MTSTTHQPLSTRKKILRSIMAVVLLGAGVAIVNAAAAQSSRPVIYVSLTWDDGRASQVASLDIQREHSFPATYYVNSAMIDSSPYYMTRAQLDDVAATGNEIGGHTERHENLTAVPLDAARATVCSDRARLVSWYGDGAGRSFAYPFGAYNPDVQSIVEGCGYASARGVTGVMTPTACSSCRVAESVAPADRWALAAPTSVGPTTSLTDLQFQVVQAANNGGGWVIFTMHAIANPSDPLSIDPALYRSFLDWLASRSDVQVRTIGDVMASGSSTPVPAPTTEFADSARTPVEMRNAGLEVDANGDRVSDCFVRTGYGTRTGTWTRTPNAHGGAIAEEVTITSYTSGDWKLLPALDGGTAAGGCSPSVDPSHAYEVSLWYRSTIPTSIVVYRRDGAGAWSYWLTGPKSPAIDTWSRATFDVGPPPAGTTALSWGLSVGAVGTVAVDDFAISSMEVAPAMVDPLVTNSSLERDANFDGTPDCFTPSGFGASSWSAARVPDAHSGHWGERLSVTSWSSGDRKVVVPLDGGRAAGGCAMDVVAGRQYQVGVWFHSTAPTTLNVYLRDPNGGWRWWLSVPVDASPSRWTQARFSTRSVPAGSTQLSFGLGLSSVGVVVTDDYSFAPVI